MGCGNRRRHEAGDQALKGRRGGVEREHVGLAGTADVYADIRR